MCILTGLRMSAELSRRVEELSELINFMYFYKTHIQYFQSSVIRIIRQFLKEQPDTALKFIVKCSEYCNNYDFPDAWARSVRENRLISVKVSEILLDFGNRIGTSDTETQLRYTEYYIAEIRKHMIIAEEKERDNKKLYIILGISAGLLSAIMII